MRRNFVWRSEAEQRVYSSKLVGELCRLGRTDSADAAARAVRGTADRVLAVSAKGRTRWSRPILAGRLAKTKNNRRRANLPNTWLKKPATGKKLPALRRKVRELRQLVPGCRKLSVANLLEETADYIEALEKQVKAMRFLAGG